MAIEKTRAQVIASIWQALAQSGVDLSGLPHDHQEKLVSKIADNLLVTINALLDEGQDTLVDDDLPNAGATSDVEGERVLWKGRPFLSMVENYIITSERVKIIRGMLTRDIDNYELVRIQDIDLKQGISERVLGIGDITIHGRNPSDPQMELRNISKPDEVYEILRGAWLDARKRHGLQFRDYM